MGLSPRKLSEVLLLIGISVYWLTQQTLEQQLKGSIDAEVTRLKTEYDAGGLSELKDEINEADRGKVHVLFEYGVINQNSQLLTGNLNFQPFAGWQTVMRTRVSNNPDIKEQELFYIKAVSLSNTLWLGIGHNGKIIQDAGKAIIQAFLAGFILVILLGAVGGLYLSGAFLRKIESITKSTQAIIAGDLKHRLPISRNRDELDNLALLLNQMLDKIGSLIENIQEVSNDIAHDLRTPISHLKFRLENALSTNLSAEQYGERVAFAIEEVDTILATFSAMLRISQIESGSRRSGFKTVNLSDIIVSVLDALTPVAEEQGKIIHTDIDQDVILAGDKELLTQLAFNLLDNAIVHTPKNTTLKINLQASGKQIKFIVADNGPGIAEEQHLKVFQRFYRLEQSRTTPGNGLGLSIVAAIADLHKGSLTLFDNKPGLKIVLTLWRK
jgi:signal transduction histidine kinase